MMINQIILETVTHQFNQVSIMESYQGAMANIDRYTSLINEYSSEST